MAFTAEDQGTGTPHGPDLRTRLTRLAAHPIVQRWAARLPGLRALSRRDGDAIFDLVQGFVQSQVLFVIVDLGLLESLCDGPQSARELARGNGIPVERMHRVLQAGAAMGLMRRVGHDRFGITRKGAALTGVPGLPQMIRHHAVLYRDLSDPVAFLQGRTDPALARFWPYVFGADGATDAQTTAIYSDLMAQSQGLVAEDTLRAASLRGVRSLLDVGGGSGAFAEAAARRWPDLRVTLVDLPAVVESARRRLAGSPVGDRIALRPGSFRDEPLPPGFDAISLVRVLYDHRDETVRALLKSVYAALPSGGRLIVSEPMSGGDRPDPAGDVYFAFYCMAMGTGTVRSQGEIAALCRDSGFTGIRTPRPARPFVTSVVTARKN